EAVHYLRIRKAERYVLATTPAFRAFPRRVLDAHLIAAVRIELGAPFDVDLEAHLRMRRHEERGAGEGATLRLRRIDLEKRVPVDEPAGRNAEWLQAGRRWFRSLHRIAEWVMAAPVARSIAQPVSVDPDVIE